MRARVARPRHLSRALPVEDNKGFFFPLWGFFFLELLLSCVLISLFLSLRARRAQKTILWETVRAQEAHSEESSGF